MNRRGWKFPKPAGAVATAALNKRDHHQQRLEWWKTKLAEQMELIKDAGLEIEQTISMEYSSASLAGSLRGGGGARIVVKEEYQRKLDECQAKIQEHNAKVREYDGWVQVLSANTSEHVELDVEDFLFFFGQTKPAADAAEPCQIF